MKGNRREMTLRILAGSFGLAWLLGWPFMMLGQDRPALMVFVAVFWLLAYVGGPIVAVLLSKELAEGSAYLWAVGGFFAPGIVLPILALRHLRRSLRPDTVRYPEGAVVGGGPQRALGVGLAPIAPKQSMVGGTLLVGTPPGPSVAPPSSALSAAEPFARAEAVRALGQAGDPGAAGLLLVALGDRDPFVRRAAAQALGRLGGYRLVSSLISRLRDPAAAVRRQAALALGRIGAATRDQVGRSSAATALAERFRDPDPSVRKYAAEMVGTLRDPRAGAPLAGLLQDADAGVRAGAALGLGWLGDGRAGEALTRCLQDPDTGVRQYATWALSRLEPRPEAATEGWPTDGLAAVQPATGPLPTEPVVASAFAGETPEGQPPAIVLPASAAAKEADTATAAPPAWQPAPATQEMVVLPAQVRAPGVFAPETHTLAIASLATGIATWIILPIAGAIAAIITGHLAKKQMRQQPERWRGSGLATAGLVLGYTQIALLAGLFVVLVITALLRPRMSTTVEDTVPAPRPTSTLARVVVVLTATPAPQRATIAVQMQATATAQAVQAAMTTQAMRATVGAQVAQATAVAQAVQAAATAQAIQATLAAQAIQATAAAQAAVQASSQWPVVFVDDFAGNTNNWPIMSARDQYAAMTRSFVDGKYRWDMEAVQGVHATGGPSALGSVSDFAASVDAQAISAPANFSYGVAFRIDGMNHYYFGVYHSQYVAFSVAQNGQWTALLGLTPCPSLRAGGPNRITVIAQGSHFAFLINDTLVAQVDDTRLSKGGFALAAELFQPGDKAILEFDNLQLRTPTGTVLARATATGVSGATSTPIATPATPPGAESSPTRAAPGEPVVLSQRLRFDGVPQVVIPYLDGQAVNLSDLQVNSNGTDITGQMRYTRYQQDDFTLVVCISDPSRLLIVYLDPAQRQILVEPKGPGGNTLLGPQGYRLQDGSDPGLIEFSFPVRVVGVYDLSGTQGKAYAFCVRGRINSTGVLPGERQSSGVFVADSNVLAVDVAY